MNLFGAWGDKETINALAGILAAMPAVVYAVVRFMRQRTSSRTTERESDAAIVDRIESRTTTELTRMLDTAMARVTHLENELQDWGKKYDKLQSRIEACESQRAAQTETISWMKRLLQNAGIISPDDERAITPNNQAIPKRLPKKPRDPNSPGEDSVG